MFEQAADGRSFSFDFKGRDSYNLAEVIEKCVSIWPDISISEIEISASSITYYEGDDAISEITIEASPAYWKRVEKK